MTAERTSWRSTGSVLLLALVAASAAGTTAYLAVEAIFGGMGYLAAAGAYVAVVTGICVGELPPGRRLRSIVLLLMSSASLVVIAFYIMMLIFISGYT